MTLAVAAAPPLLVKICTSALPKTLLAVLFMADVTLAPDPDKSLVYHSMAPITVPSLRVVSVSSNLISGVPTLASRRIKNTLPVTLPVVLILPASTLPVKPTAPAKVVPVGLITMMLLTPPGLNVMLPLITGISTLVVPLKILSALILPVNTALPVTVRLPTMFTLVLSKVTKSPAFMV